MLIPISTIRLSVYKHHFICNEYVPTVISPIEEVRFPIYLILLQYTWFFHFLIY